LPNHISQGKFCSPPAVFYQLFEIERKILAFNDGFCFFAEIREDGRADDQPYIFEKRKIEKHQDEPENNACKSEEETKPAILKFLYPATEPGRRSEVFDNSRSRLTKKIHTGSKQQSINNSRDDDPLPKFMSDNKAVGFEIGLDSYYDFFQQDINLSKYKEPQLNE